MIELMKALYWSEIILIIVLGIIFISLMKK
jgi:hypothetical protein